jgi:hypothetical protein
MNHPMTFEQQQSDFYQNLSLQTSDAYRIALFMDYCFKNQDYIISLIDMALPEQRSMLESIVAKISISHIKTLLFPPIAPNSYSYYPNNLFVLINLNIAPIVLSSAWRTFDATQKTIIVSTLLTKQQRSCNMHVIYMLNSATAIHDYFQTPGLELLCYTSFLRMLFMRNNLLFKRYYQNSRDILSLYTLLLRNAPVNLAQKVLNRINSSIVEQSLAAHDPALEPLITNIEHLQNKFYSSFDDIMFNATAQYFGAPGNAVTIATLDSVFEREAMTVPLYFSTTAQETDNQMQQPGYTG